MKNTIVINSNCYHGFSIYEALDGIHKAGCHNVELTATKGWTEHVFPSQSLTELIKVKNYMQKLKIKTVAMSGHCNLMDDERIYDFIENIELAHFYEVKTIVSSVGEAHLKDKSVSGDDHLIENINKCLPYLKKYDMQLVLETHGEHGTGARLKAITDRLDKNYVGVCYDTANVIFYGDVDPKDEMLTCMDSIKYMHVKDKAGAKKEWNFPALGDGYVDFKGIFENLKRHDLTCPLSVEIEFTQKGPASLQEVDDAVLTSAKFLASHGFVL